MSLLYWLQQLRTPIGDAFFSAITYLGDEAGFLAVALVLYWCIDKNAAYYLAAIGFSGTAVNQTLKMMFRIPRPWVLDPNFTIVESAREAATGYSFPSGHTQNAVGIWGGLAVTRRSTWARILAFLPVVLVPISRMYLGVHTPMDVGVSALIAVLLVAVFYPLSRRAQHDTKALVLLLAPGVVLGVLTILYMSLASFPADVDAVHLTAARANAWKLTGAAAAMLVSALIDRKKLHFETRAPIPAQLLKAILGIALVLGLKAVLKAPLCAILPQSPSDLIRYFVTVLAAGILWPMTFPYLARIGVKKHHE